MSRSRIAVLVDVDGTLASPYRSGVRTLRPSALEALRLLAEHAEVYLWSHAGAGNGERLLDEFPELRIHVSGSFAKQGLPRSRFDTVFCIDDEAVDEEVLRENHVVLGESFDGGDDSDLLLRAVQLIVERLAL